MQVLAGISDPASLVFQESLHELGKICGVKKILPKSCVISDSLLDCAHEGASNGSRVRITRVKMDPKGDPQKTKEVCT